MTSNDPHASAEDENGPAGDADESEYAAAERLTFFSDAVIAIAMTLLAIELPQPVDGTAGEMAASAWHLRGEYIAFLVSFWVISQHWRAHHFLFHLVDRLSPRLITVNMVWLLLIVITPFTTKLLSEGDSNLLRFGTYAATQGLQSLLFVLMLVEIRRKNLFRTAENRHQTDSSLWRTVVFAATFLLSIPVYVVAGRYAFFMWFLLPVGFGLIQRRLGRRVATNVGGA